MNLKWVIAFRLFRVLELPEYMYFICSNTYFNGCIVFPRLDTAFCTAGACFGWVELPFLSHIADFPAS